MPFVTKLIVTPARPAGHWRVHHGCPLVYRGAREVFMVPPGFVTDFGSVPWLASWLVSPTHHVEAFVLHDWLYHSGAVPRSDADGIMRRVLGELGSPAVSRWSAWAGVRLGGWLAWDARRFDEQRRRRM